MLLQDDALQLAELDRQLIRAVVEVDLEKFSSSFAAYQALRKSLRTRLLDEPVASITDPDAAEVLRKITTREGLPSDKVIERLSAQLDESRASQEFDDQELRQIGSDLFYSWFSHHEYIAGLAELRPLIVRGSVAETVSRLVRQVKGCYAFQQYDAAYGLCRTVIEASVRDICVRRQLFPDLGDNVLLFEEFKWSQLRDKVCTGPLRQRLKTLYLELCALLHGRKTVTREEARRAFEETLQVVEELYATHGL